MIVKRTIAVHAAILACVGMALILAGFFLAVPRGDRSSVAWLDVTVCEIVFLFNFSTLPIVRPRSEGFSEQIPKLGILWTAHISYTGFAVAGMWYGWVGGFAFGLQTLYHLALLFLVLTVVSLAGQASKHAGRVAASERHRSDTLQTVKSAVGDCEAAFLRLPGGRPAEYYEFQHIKDDVRYLSPCDAPRAISLDLEIAELLGDLCATLSAANRFPPGPSELQDALTRCRTLVRLRKQERIA